MCIIRQVVELLRTKYDSWQGFSMSFVDCLLEFSIVLVEVADLC